MFFQLCMYEQKFRKESNGKIHIGFSILHQREYLPTNVNSFEDFTTLPFAPFLE